MKRKLPLLALQTCSSTVAMGIGPPEGKNSEGNNANGIMAAADNGQSGIAVTRISCGNDCLFPKENSGRREGNSHCRIWQNERQARDLRAYRTHSFRKEKNGRLTLLQNKNINEKGGPHMDLNKEFTNGEVTILWQPRKCTHAGTCIRLLPNVYQPGRKPWIRPENATTEELIRQVAQCPSGALSIKKKAAETVRTDLEDDGKKGRFVLYAQDTRAGEMTFSWAGDRLFIIDHTEVDEAFGGKGYGGKLVKAGVDYARQRQVKVTPLCPFAKREFEKHADYQDVLFG